MIQQYLELNTMSSHFQMNVNVLEDATELERNQVLITVHILIVWYM